MRSLPVLSMSVLGGLVLAGVGPRLVVAQSERALTVVADSQSANTNTGVIVAEGNVTIRYPAEQVVGQSQKATYYTREQRIVMEGNVDVVQGDNRLQAETVTYLLERNTIEALPTAGGQVESVYVFPSEEEPTGEDGGAPEDIDVDVDGAL
ncbi:MAG: LptA/OstA family protein [Cyanobacteria bacterium P01_E01_bin.34]